MLYEVITMMAKLFASISWGFIYETFSFLSDIENTPAQNFAAGPDCF